MDWSGSLAGRRLNPYITAIAMAISERRKALWFYQGTVADEFDYIDEWLARDMSARSPAWPNNYGSPLFSVGASSLEGGEMGRAIDRALNDFIADDADGVFGQNYVYACNHNDNSGDWDGVSAVRVETGRRWDWPTILADIGDPERIFSGAGVSGGFTKGNDSYLSAAWLKQVYEILNRIKWFVQQGSDGAWASWKTHDGMTNPRYSRDFTSTAGYASDALAEAAANDGYDAASDSTSLPSLFGSGTFEDPHQMTEIGENGYGIWDAGIAANENRISFFKEFVDLDFDYDLYALISGHDEFDDYGTGWPQDLYSRIQDGSVTGAAGYHDMPVIGSTTPRPSPFFAGTKTPVPSTNSFWSRGWIATDTVIVKKYDVTNGFQFLA